MERALPVRRIHNTCLARHSRLRAERICLTRQIDRVRARVPMDRLLLDRLEPRRNWIDQEIDRAEEEARALGYGGVLF